MNKNKKYFLIYVVNILLGLGTVWLALDMGKRLFDRRKAWIFAAFVGLLPGSLFVFRYVQRTGSLLACRSDLR